MEFIIPFGQGVGSWFATGLDDIILLGIILVSARKKGQVLAIVTGQVLAVVAVLTVTNIAITWLQTLGLIPASYRVLSGTILTAVGIYLFKSSSDDDEEDSERSSWFLMAIAAFWIYVTNATDDFSVMLGILIPLTLSLRIVFSVGFLMGWTASFVLAYRGSEIKAPWLIKSLTFALYGWGLFYLLTGFWNLAPDLYDALVYYVPGLFGSF